MVNAETATLRETLNLILFMMPIFVFHALILKDLQLVQIVALDTTL